MTERMVRAIVFALLRRVGISIDMENAKITISTEVNFTGGIEVGGAQVSAGANDSAGSGFRVVRLPNV